MSDKHDIAGIVQELKSSGIRYLRFELPDLHGISRSKVVPIDKVESYAHNGLNLYGGTLGLDTASSVVPGTGLHEEINYADTHLFPDFDTVQRLPWKPGMAKVICDVHFLDHRPLPQAPRRVLENLLHIASEMGFHVTLGHEFEFYLLDGETHQPFFEGLHIFNTVRNDQGDFLTGLLDHLQGVGVDVITHNCEYAGSQYEINFGPGRGLAGADKAFTFKNTTKELAHRAGLLATFMSKPWPDRAGSGCHVHLGLTNRDNGSNAMLNAGAADGLSTTAHQFVAGILVHAPAMMALCDPTPNCYHRLKPHTFAPSNISWGVEDRTALVRVKATRDERTHIEMRGASALSNPYLSAAAVLAAGLLGIRNGLSLEPEVDGPSEENESLPKLPGSLEEALGSLMTDAAMQGMLGEEFVKLYTTVKRFELGRFRAHITDWERDEYLTVY